LPLVHFRLARAGPTAVPLHVKTGAGGVLRDPPPAVRR